MRRRLLSSLSFAEKEFYLDEFHEKSLLFAVRAADRASAADLRAASEVFETLVHNDTRVLVLFETGGGPGALRRIGGLHRRLARAAKTPQSSPLVFSAEEPGDRICLRIWEVLRDTRVCAGTWPSDARVSLEHSAERIAERLRVYKLVFVDPLGGLSRDGKMLSFLNAPGLQSLLRRRGADSAGFESRRPVLEAIFKALEGGVLSVSLCPLAGVGHELFTYEGCGTVFTRGDYFHVEKLGIDDFHEVERLLQRAERDGYLKPRTPEEMARLLLHGYGVRLGPSTTEPAGFCALFPYPGDRAAEIAGLFTITRYQGEGVGGMLVDAMVSEGKRQGFGYIFACTNQQGAQRLFLRHGFRRVDPGAVPAEKWRGYDPARLEQIRIYRRDLARSKQGRG